VGLESLLPAMSCLIRRTTTAKRIYWKDSSAAAKLENGY